MNKKERKLLEEKISAAVSETVKAHGLQSTAAFLKSVKKHSKAISKKLVKELAPPVKKGVSEKPKTAAVKKAATAKKPTSLAVKNQSKPKK